MNTNYIPKSVKTLVFASFLAAGLNLHASTVPTAQVLVTPVESPVEFQPMAFNNSAEAGMLRQAYHILAHGDHDYKGNRVKAMHAVEAAGKLLGLNLRGDDKDREPQALSDAKLREAQSLISNVLASAEVKNQKRVTKHLEAAINHINVALAVK